jgi:uncharacterized membrane protein
MGAEGRKYVWATLIVGVIVHLAVVYATPRLLMRAAIERMSEGSGVNAWRVSDRVTAQSRQIVRPSPDFAYSACVYDLSQGPVVLRAAEWEPYWSLSLYAENTDNFYVIDDREADYGAEITLVRAGRPHPDDAATVVESPSRRGIALIRRLAPSPETHAAAASVARERAVPGTAFHGVAFAVWGHGRNISPCAAQSLSARFCSPVAVWWGRTIRSSAKPPIASKA